MIGRISIVVLLLALCLTGCKTESTSNGNAAIRVDDIDLTDIGWGETKVPVTITNKVDDLRWITIKVETQFLSGSESGARPNRKTLTHGYLVPDTTVVFEPTVYMPGNFGEVEISLEVYDVVDTADVLMDRYRVYERSFTKNFKAPRAVSEMAQIPIALPPRVDSHPFFDNDLTFLTLQLIDEGKTLPEIAEMTGADLEFLQVLVDRLKKHGDIRGDGDKYELAFPLIAADQAKELGELAEEAAEELMLTIEENLPRLKTNIDSLVASGAIEDNPREKYGPGSVLHHPYITVSALVLWWHLGQEFITRSAPLVIYDGTDVCNARIPNYMYMVQGGPELNGHCHYDYLIRPNTYNINFGDRVPVYNCGPNFLLNAIKGRRTSYTPEDGYQSVTFAFDTLTVLPTLRALSGGYEDKLETLYTKARDISCDKYGQTRFDFGQRYWFWNLVASRTIDKLVSRETLAREGNGQYRLTGYRQPTRPKKETRGGH